MLGARTRDASLISHATTLATNALLTRSGLAITALVANEGFRDILEIGRQRRPEVYDLETRRPPPLVERRDRLTVRCRGSADGTILERLDEGRARRVARLIVRREYKSVAVAFLNSYVNPVHEVRMREILVGQGFRGKVSLSSEVDREFREYERTSTTVVNACLEPLMSAYLLGLAASLRRRKIDAPLYVMNSDGGMNTSAFVASRPVSSIESGPAAGVVASIRLASDLSLDRVLTFDMGGTTAKAGAVIDGEAARTSEFEAAGRTHSGRSIQGSGYPVRGNFIDLAEVSAGGGTVAWVDEVGQLRVGPRSSGSNPGPACYGRGGSEPTVTDANLVLGRVNGRHLLGGAMPIRSELAYQSLEGISRGLGISREDSAKGIVRLVNDAMSKAISIVSVQKGRDPRDFTLFSFGGAGPIHACDLAEELGIRKVIVPIHAGLFSAYGLLAADVTRTFTMPIMGPAKSLGPRFKELERQAAREMRQEGFRKSTIARSVEARYEGQSHEILVPYSDESGLRRKFDSLHRELYGYATSDELQAVNLRVVVRIRRPKPTLAAQSSEEEREEPSRRMAWLGGETGAVPVHTREGMSPGDHGVGPCIMEEYDSTTVVNPVWRWRVEEFGTRLSR